MYTDLSDFISRTEVVIDDNYNARIKIGAVDGVPITLRGFVTSSSWDDFDIKEEGWEYYKQLIKQVENLKMDEQNQMSKSEGLTYEEALAALKEGSSVKLPEWEGIWFPIRDKIYVFTKDNEILDTPDHETYSQRNDWTLQIGEYNIPIRFVKALRRRLDNTLRYINEGAAGRSREASAAATSTQLGFMWLGQALGEFGAEYPYPKSSDPSSPVIEKHADKADGDHLEILKDTNNDETYRVKYLRADLGEIMEFIVYISNFGHAHHLLMIARGNLTEAKMWLGQQLNNIRIKQEEQARFFELEKPRKLQLAKDAYARYGSVTDFKNFQGNPMPSFEELPEKIQQAWVAATNIQPDMPYTATVAGSSVSLGRPY